MTVHEISLHTAMYDPTNTNMSLTVNYVEKANCLKGYAGFSCEQCAEGASHVYVDMISVYMVILKRLKSEN